MIEKGEGNKKRIDTNDLHLVKCISARRNGCNDGDGTIAMGDGKKVM